MRNAGMFGFVAVAAVVVWGWIFHSLFESPVPATTQANVTAQTGVTAAGEAAPSPHGYVTGLESLPASLRDIDVDGALRVDANGELVLDVMVRNLFDYFLNAVGEEPAEQIVARIRAYIRSHLPASAQAEAQRVLGEYLALREAAEAAQAVAEHERQDAMPEDEWSASALRERMAALRDLRTRHLSPEVYKAFYADEDLFDEYTIGKFEIMQTPGLTPVEQSRRIAALEDTLPAPLRASIEAVSRHQTLSMLTEQWQHSEGDATALRSIRENIVGAAAADRLEALDAKRANWNRKVEQWLQERATLLANPALEHADRHEAVEQRRDEIFAASERTRIKAIEHMRDQRSGEERLND